MKNYLITTNYYPKSDYDIGNGQFIKIVKNPYDYFNSNEKLRPLIGGTNWKYSLVIPDSYQCINDLVLFHTFITKIRETYQYAENAHKLSFENDELEFIDDRDLIRKRGGMIEIIEFGKFPLLMNCNHKPYSEMKYEHIDYKIGFEKFLELKSKPIKGLTGKYNLYDLICLYEFARSFEITQRVYHNANLSLSFYITILESLIGEPKKCKTKLRCDGCGRGIGDHHEISLEQHFKKYFKRVEPIMKIRNIRHKFFHKGNFFNFSKYFSDISMSKENWTDDKTIHLYEHEKEEIECVIRILLTNEFYNYYKNA